MTPADLTQWRNALGITRADACARLGIAPNTYTAYQEGRTAIPQYIALACAAVLAGLEPYGAPRTIDTEQGPRHGPAFPVSTGMTRSS